MKLDDIARDIVNGLLPVERQVPTEDVAFVLERLQVVVAYQREACAQAADSMPAFASAKDAAVAIRARATPAPPAAKLED